MTNKPDAGEPAPERLSLRRWSRRKLDAVRTEQQATPPQPADAPPMVEPMRVPPASAPTAAPEPLPPVETLTPESDFTAFFQRQGKVDEALKRAALKQLLRDPRFNVMDGLDIYVGDYTQSVPIPDDVIKRLVQAQAIFNPPRTMVNAEGHVVDVPPEAEVVATQPIPAPLEQVPAEPLPALVDDTAPPGDKSVSATGQTDGEHEARSAKAGR